jgi:type I restriction enzyme R subunit
MTQGVGAVDALPTGIREDPVAVAETLDNNIRKVITDEAAVNPHYYAEMSELLDALIRARKQQALDYAAYLERIVALSQQVINPQGGLQYGERLDTGAKRALYDNLNCDEALALAIDGAIRAVNKDGWRSNRIKE